MRMNLAGRTDKVARAVMVCRPQGGLEEAVERILTSKSSPCMAPPSMPPHRNKRMDQWLRMLSEGAPFEPATVWY
jgi:hypothetical protein